MSVICIFGDSITWGAWDLELGGWVNRLRNYFENKNFETDVYNLGVSGDKVSDVIKRFDIEAESRNPDTIIFAIGINDSPNVSHPLGTKLDIFEKQYEELLARAKKFTKKIILVGLTNVSLQIGLYRNSKIKNYNGIIKKIAKSHNLIFVDLFETLAKDDLEDGLHPNAKGHQKIFEKVKETL